jgi:peptide deformylase
MEVDMSKILRKTEFGNPVLRDVAHRLSSEEIVSADIQALIEDMYYTVEQKRYGVGLAAPQVGRGMAISVIAIKSTPSRPDLKPEKLTIINPEIMQFYGRKSSMWEGCISGLELYAQVPRYKRLRLKWMDEQAKQHEQDFDGFIAHVIQHEVDHLNGILYVDKIKNTKSIMTIREYKKMRERERAQAKSVKRPLGKK